MGQIRLVCGAQKIRLVWGALCIGAMACVGTIGNSNGGGAGPSPTSGSTSGSTSGAGSSAGSSGSNVSSDAGTSSGIAVSANGDDGGAAESAASSCTTVSPGAAPLRRLTQSEYNNTVHDLLGDTTQPANQFPPDQKIGEFSNTAVALTVPPLLAQAYQTAAEQLAATALANPSMLLPCNPVTAGEDSCAQSFIQSFGKRAYRRPLTATDASALFALYTANRTGADFNNGIRSVIEAVLQSADFLYRVEFGDVGQLQGTVVPLNPYEMASRLSYFLWGSMPDAALFMAADTNQLATKDQVAGQARRMLKSSSAQNAVAQFFTQWLTLDQISGVAKDPKTFPAFTSTLQTAMRNETLSFVNWVIWQSDRKLPTLLTSTTSFVNAELASLYGLTGVTGTTAQQVQLDPSQRAGLLTQPSLMTLLGKPDRTSPVLRGKFVREALLCEQVPPPPQNIVITPPVVMPGVSTRAQFIMHESVLACATCHVMMDHVGFAFEEFDGIGRYRTTDQGQPVDATGTLTGTDVNGPFQNATDLSRELSRSQQVSDCFATQWFRYAMGRGETTDDNCSLQTLTNAFTTSQTDIVELLVAVTQTDAFRYRPQVMP